MPRGGLIDKFGNLMGNQSILINYGRPADLGSGRFGRISPKNVGRERTREGPSECEVSSYAKRQSFLPRIVFARRKSCSAAEIEWCDRDSIRSCSQTTFSCKPVKSRLKGRERGNINTTLA